MKQKLIGTTEYVFLPDVSEDALPAKIDTGADGSAIWASSILEQKGELSYVLFDSQSSFYTGEELRTKDYRVISVKNSFGEKEYRYRVKLRIKIASRTYVSSFTLADRSRSRFPILIGKRFLKNKFFVDVSQHNLTYQSDDEPIKHVVVLTSRIDQPTKDFFADVANISNLAVHVEKYRQLGYQINENSQPKITLPDGSDIANASKVYFKAHALYPEHAQAIAHYLHYRHVAFFDKEISSGASRSKLSELFALACGGVAVPKMRVFSNGATELDFKELKTFFDGQQFVLKDPYSDRGRNNFFVSDKKSFTEATKRLEKTKTIIAQQYIPNDGFLRILLMRNDVTQVVSRTSSDHDDALKRHLNKPHGSTNATVLKVKEYDAEAIVIARRAALVMDRTIAGVDMIQDKHTKKWYVLEVNYNPELTAGLDVKKKAKGIARLFSQEGND